MISIATFNANNFFLRYKFSKNIPNSFSKDSLIEASEVVGYMPGLAFNKYGKKNYVVWDSTRRELATKALLEPDGKLPDVICFQEVENIEAIRILNQRYFKNYYKYSLLIDSYDPRNIDVGVLSRYPINNIRTHIDDLDDQGKRIFSRDCLEVEVILDSGESLYVFANHLKSKLVKRQSSDTDEKYKEKLLKSHGKRLKQAQYIADIIKDRFMGQYDTALYAVIGDFNDTPYSPWLKPLIESPYLIDAITEHLPYNERWTYYWKNRNKVSQIDYFLVSESLNKRIKKAIDLNPNRKPFIQRKGISFRESNQNGTLPKKTNYIAFEEDEVTQSQGDHPDDVKLDFRFDRYQEVIDNPKNNISDHCPITIWFK